MVEIQDKILPSSTAVNMDNNYVKSKRRLTFKKSTGTFLLSHCNSLFGVVTSCKPKVNIFDDFTHDVYMPVQNRNMLEQRVIIPRDIHLYQPEQSDRLPRYPDEISNQASNSRTLSAASHVLKLKNLLNTEDSIHIEFWPFYAAPTLALSKINTYQYKQADHRTIDSLNIVHKFTLSLRDLRNLSNGFMEDWLLGKSKYLGRKTQNDHYLKLEISNSGFKVERNFEDGIFLDQYTTAFQESELDDAVDNGIYLSNHIALAIRVFSHLEVNGDIRCSSNRKILIFEFETDAGTYRIDIPKCDDNLQPYTDIFQIYEPEIYVTGFEEQSLHLAPSISEFIQIQPDGVIPDYIIEQHLRSGCSDDYDDLLDNEPLLQAGEFSE